jgi:hypothetical protein
MTTSSDLAADATGCAVLSRNDSVMAERQGARYAADEGVLAPVISGVTLLAHKQAQASTRRKMAITTSLRGMVVRTS